MAKTSFRDFKDTLRVISLASGSSGDKLYTYWNNSSIDASSPIDLDEIIHITQRTDGSFCLAIANCIFEGDLEDLEIKLYEWALDEGWLD
jgi:hypothetical protein